MSQLAKIGEAISMVWLPFSNKEGCSKSFSTHLMAFL
jgi:hypothetical protein